MDNKYAYLAGIIDGEGYIGISKYNVKGREAFYKARITIANTNLDLLKHCQTIAPGHIQACKPPPEGKPWTQGYRLTMAYLDTWLPKVIPFLVGKKRKAELLHESLSLLHKRTKKDRAKRHERIEEINQLLRKKEWLV